ncbi:MAG: ATPase, T2SS/T4P/T4SS family [Thermodesulfovibrionales bacterium]
MKTKKDIDFGRLLVREGFISEEVLSKALELQTEAPDKKLGEILIEMGVPEETVLRGLSRKLGIAFVDRNGIAIHAALTGHLIFSTLHTNDAPGAMTRLMDMGVENYLVSSTLIGVVAQRLVRRICNTCKVEYRVPEELKRELKINQDILWRGAGCEKCSSTGYRGRKGLKTFIAISGLLTLILSLERFYTYAFIYDPLRSDYRSDTIPETQKRQDKKNGLTAVKDGAVYRIVLIDTAKQQPVPVELGKKLVIESGFVTQIIPLENIKASDAANTLRSLLPRGADLIIYEPSNLLILTAPPHAVIKFMKILEALDIPIGDREGIKTFVYYVENGEAKKLIEVLKTIYAEKKGKTTTPVIRPPQPQPVQPGQKPATTTEVPSAEIEGEIVMTAYEDINAIIFKCTPRAYLEILETLKKLDIPPKQVLIEVLIAEVTLDDKLQFGIEWLVKGSTKIEGNRAGILGGFATEPSNFFETTGSGDKVTIDLTKFKPVVSSGVFANILDPERFNALISMLAGKSKLNVLASPHILALDNKEAKIEVGSEIPVATGLVQQPSTTGGATLVSQGQIQYRTAGIILTVTPYISDKNQVTLKIAQEYSAPGAPTKIAGQEFPSFITRRANTTGIVQDGHTLVIGGLISEQTTHSRSGIPLLSDIPLIGWLFGSTSITKTKTELLVMVTPRVISSQEEADKLVNEFKERVRTIKEKIEKK